MADIRVDIELKSGDGVYSVDGSRINSIKSLVQSNSDASSIFYGVVSSTGSVDISDVNGEIKNLIEDDIIDYSGVKLDVFAKNNKIASHKTGDSEYDNDLLNITLTDELSDVSTATYSNPNESNYLSSVSGFGLLNAICVKSTPKISMPSQKGFIPNGNGIIGVYEYLNLIKFKDIDLKLSGDDSITLLNEFCSATQTSIYVDNNGKPVITPARPICPSLSSAPLRSKGIFIPQKYIYENRPKSLFLKNKIKRVEMSVDELAVEDLSIRNLTTDPRTLEEFQNKAFFESEDINVSEGLDTSNAIYEDENYYVFSRTVSSDGYIYIDPTEYTIGYYAPENTSGHQLYYILDYGSDGNKFVLNNHLSVQDFITSLNNYLSKVDYETARLAYPVMCGFLKSDMTQSRNEYTIVYAILKSAIERNNLYRFFILPKPTERTMGPHGGGWIQIPKRRYTKKTNTVEITTSDSFKANESIKLNTGNFLTAHSTILLDGEEVSLVNYLGQGILYDYSNGIKTKSVQIVCGDLYFVEDRDKLAVNWNYGELLNIGDIVQIEDETYKDGNYINWKITGLEFVFDGETYCNLELQECIGLSSISDYRYGLYQDGVMVYDWAYLTANDLIAVNNNAIEKASTELSGKLVLPRTITSIGNGAFSGCSGLTEIIIPDTVTYVGNKAFANCSGLTNVEIPDSVTYVGYSCFSVCSGLESIKLPKNITEIKYQTFEVCSSLKSVEIPYGVTKIGDSAFSNCSSLTNVYIPDTVTAFGQSVFKYCSALKHIYLPSSLTQIYTANNTNGLYTFYRCLSTLVIYCGASSKPSGFETNWNYNATASDTASSVYLTVKYGYTRAQYESETK